MQNSYHNTLYITAEAYKRLIAYTVLVEKHEVSGIAKLSEDCFGVKYISDILLTEQEASSASFDTSAEAFTKAYMGIPEEDRINWCVHWHSHVQMDVFVSSTDKDNYDEQRGKFKETPFIALIVNQYGDMHAVCYYQSPAYTEVVFDDVFLYEAKDKLAGFTIADTTPGHIIERMMPIVTNSKPLTDVEIEDLETEIKEKVKLKTHKVIKPTYTKPLLKAPNNSADVIIDERASYASGLSEGTIPHTLAERMDAAHELAMEYGYTLHSGLYYCPGLTEPFAMADLLLLLDNEIEEHLAEDCFFFDDDDDDDGVYCTDDDNNATLLK